MRPAPAQYLLRVDDLCPTTSRERWQLFRALIEEFRLQPILAVVPDNRDHDLAVSEADSSFSGQMRALEYGGSMIGLHGYRHLCHSCGRNRLGLDRASEFAGVPSEMQRKWIGEGLRILRGHGLNPRIFVPPHHGFDTNTLSALRSEGIPLLSDGFARRPFLCGEVTWIPQQLWAAEEKVSGVWTICVHPNTASAANVAGVRAFLRAHAGQFTSVDRLLDEVPATTLTLAERLHAEAALCRFKLFRAARRAHQFAGSRLSNSK
jgi:predicted deacetylase